MFTVGYVTGYHPVNKRGWLENPLYQWRVVIVHKLVIVHCYVWVQIYEGYKMFFLLDIVVNIGFHVKSSGCIAHLNPSFPCWSHDFCCLILQLRFLLHIPSVWVATTNLIAVLLRSTAPGRTGTRVVPALFWKHICKPGGRETWDKIVIYICGCVFFSGVQILVRVGSSSSANHTHESYPEPYPESYLRIIPPKITIMNVSFGIVWDCMPSLVLMDVTSQLTSVGQIRWSLAAFTYLHDMSGEAGWLARWLAAWLARLGGYGNCCCWLGGWL